MRKEDDKKKNLSYLLHFFDSIHTHIFRTKTNQKEIKGRVGNVIYNYCFKVIFTCKYIKIVFFIYFLRMVFSIIQKH
jgi:hypothetical protein